MRPACKISPAMSERKGKLRRALSIPLFVEQLETRLPPGDILGLPAAMWGMALTGLVAYPRATPPAVAGQIPNAFSETKHTIRSNEEYELLVHNPQRQEHLRELLTVVRFTPLQDAEAKSWVVRATPVGAPALSSPLVDSLDLFDLFDAPQGLTSSRGFANQQATAPTEPNGEVGLGGAASSGTRGAGQEPSSTGAYQPPSTSGLNSFSSLPSFTTGAISLSTPLPVAAPPPRAHGTIEPLAVKNAGENSEPNDPTLQSTCNSGGGRPVLAGFIESVSVPTDNPMGVDSFYNLGSNEQFTLIASGDFRTSTTPNPDLRADAEYYDFAAPKDLLNGIDIGIKVSGFTPDSSALPFWGAYSPDHTYYVWGTGAGTRVHLNYLDDGSYSDNLGTLTVDIY